MSFRPEELPDVDHAAPVDAETLYRQGMEFYRARRWKKARECFVRLRDLEPDRRGIDSLIGELDHFIRLRGVRPALAASEVRASGPRPALAQRWLLVLPIVAAFLVVGTVALAGAGVFSPDGTPSPSAIPLMPMLTAKAVDGRLQLQAAGASTWQEWTNGRLLRTNDRIKALETGTAELTLPDGKVSARLSPGTIVEMALVGADGSAKLRQTGGRLRIESGSVLIQVDALLVSVQPVQSGATWQIVADVGKVILSGEAGQVRVTSGMGSLLLAAGEQGEWYPDRPPAITRPESESPTPMHTPSPTATATAELTKTATPTATATGVVSLPTSTAKATDTPAPAATSEPLQPTNTPAPVIEPPPPPAPTATQAPPMNTPAAPTSTPQPPPTPTRPKR